MCTHLVGEGSAEGPAHDALQVAVTDTLFRQTGLSLDHDQRP